MKIITFIRNLIKRGVVTKKTPDSGQFSVAQVKWLTGKTGNVEVIHPYGFSSYAPVGSLALMFNVMGHEENRAAIINDPKRRFKDLKEGEIAIGNFLTRSYVKFKENGDIEVISTNNRSVTIAGNDSIVIGGDCNITTTGNTTVTTTGNTTIDSTGNMSATIGGTLTANVTGNTNLTTPVATVTGALRVTGEITAFYGLVNQISFTNIKNTYNTHTHDENDNAPSPTDAPNEQLP